MNRVQWGIFLFLFLVPLMRPGTVRSEKKPDEEGNAEISTLTFSAKDLTGEPAFLDWTQDGTAMQLIARKDETGEVRLAFNTCQSCGGSPYAWFEYRGNNTLQCQNCGQPFALDTVGITRAAGCNPVSITEFVVEGDTVTVPQNILAENVYLFTNWKKTDQ